MSPRGIGFHTALEQHPARRFFALLTPKRQRYSAGSGVRRERKRFSDEIGERVLRVVRSSA